MSEYEFDTDTVKDFIKNNVHKNFVYIIRDTELKGNVI
jgi:hypothetical protein